MRELGYLEGRDYGVEGRYADGDASRLPLLAEELVRLKPDVIVAATTPGALAAKQATATIPIVGVNLTDPVGFGLIASEAHPGTNVTGIHEIKHDGYRMMVRRDVSGVRLLTRNGKDWTGRFPTIVQAAAGLKARSCLIDGEAVACDENGLAVFALLRYRLAGQHRVPLCVRSARHS
jgi:hypothetical protein